MKFKLFSFSFLLFAVISFSHSESYDPSFEIQGIVYDEYKSPLIGVSVLEQGTKQRTTTDFDGKFTIQVTNKNAILEFRYVGFDNQTINLKEHNLSKILEVTMNTGNSLSEVVVTTASKRSSTKQHNSNDMELGAVSYSDQFERSPAPIMNVHEQRPPEDGNYSAINEQSFFDPRDQPLSTLSIDVDRAAYSNVRRFLQQGMLPNPDAVRIEEMINYFNYEYPEPNKQSDQPFAIQTTMTDCPWNQQHQLLHIGMQAKNMDRDEIPPSNFVFLIDVSGSMSSPNKLPLLKSAFKLLVNQLTNEDRIAIVVYAGAAGCVLESTPGSEKEKIWDALDRLNSGGSTAGAAGIQLAYKIAQQNLIKDGNNRIILATDGDFNVGTNGDEALVNLIEKERNHGVFLSIMGFGTGNYQDGKMQKIADAGNGNHSYIDNMQEAKKVLMDEFAGTLFTLAKDVKIQIEFNTELVSSYRMIGYENRVLEARDFNDDTKDAGELGAGHSVTILYEVIPAGVTSNFQVSIDPLKYQKDVPKKERTLKNSTELATIKARYKAPDSDVSTRSEQIISNELADWNEVSSDVRWAASIAEWGMQMRQSKYLNQRNYKQLIEQMKKIIKTESDPYKNSCLDLVEIAYALQK